MSDDEPTVSAASMLTSSGAWLLVVERDGTARAHPLPAAGRVTIGRSHECDVVIDHRSVSRRHGLLLVGPRLRIENLESTRGVQVRDRMLGPGEGADLAPGEIARLGSVMLAVQHGSAFAGNAERRFDAIERPRSRAWSATGIVAKDPAMVSVLALVERVANSRISVLLTGETGVGKEVVAGAIHRCSARARAPFVRINCAALSASLIESELFGHVRGSFTGADRDKVGLLETAASGTVFLDEVAELAPPVQAKLLRVLEEREVFRVGDNVARPIDARFVAATNRDLEADVAAQSFRPDLFYRLNGISIHIPPLRERPSDIEPLVMRFLADATPPHESGISREAAAALKRHAWPGNVRELRNTVERAALLAGEARIELEHLPKSVATSVAAAPARAAGGAAPEQPRGPAPLRTEVDALERARILTALEQCGGNQTRAAQLLGISRRTLISRLDVYGVSRPRKTGRDDA